MPPPFTDAPIRPSQFHEIIPRPQVPALARDPQHSEPRRYRSCIKCGGKQRVWAHWLGPSNWKDETGRWIVRPMSRKEKIRLMSEAAFREEFVPLPGPPAAEELLDRGGTV